MDKKHDNQRPRNRKDRRVSLKKSKLSDGAKIRRKVKIIKGIQMGIGLAGLAYGGYTWFKEIKQWWTLKQQQQFHRNMNKYFQDLLHKDIKYKQEEVVRNIIAFIQDDNEVKTKFPKRKIADRQNVELHTKLRISLELLKSHGYLTLPPNYMYGLCNVLYHQQQQGKYVDIGTVEEVMKLILTQFPSEREHFNNPKPHECDIIQMLFNSRNLNK